MARVDLTPAAGDDFLEGVFGIITHIEGSPEALERARIVVNFGRTIRSYEYYGCEYSDKLDCWYPLK